MFASRLVVVDATTRCNQNCVFCYEKHIHFTRPDMSFEAIKKIIAQAKRDGFDSLTFIGGEITMVDWLLPVIPLLHEAGLRPGIVTNGLNLSSRAYVRELMLAGLASLEITCLSHNAQDDARTSHVKDGFLRRRTALENVAALRYLNWNTFNFAVNTVITTINYASLPQLAQSVLEFSPDLVTVKMLGLTREHLLRHSVLVPRLSELKKPVADTLRLLDKNRVPFTCEDIPLCFLPAKYRANSKICERGRQYLFEHWNVSGERVTVSSQAARRKPQSELSQCRACALCSTCPKPQDLYIKLFGGEEFTPVNSRSVR